MRLPAALGSLLFVGLACAQTVATTNTIPAPRPQAAAVSFDHEHAAWNRFIARHVRGDQFDYAAAKKDPADLRAYVQALVDVTPARMAAWSDGQRYAFWINAYNAFTIQKVVDNYPLASIRDLSGLLGIKSVFDDEFIPMNAFHPEGKDDRLSLNDIEHGILRAGFKDARVHAAINCASVSCPPLRAEAFVAPRLDAQLDEQMKRFVADRVRNVVDRQRGVVKLSKIFDWFSEDFERDAGSVRAYLLRHAPEAEREFLAEARLAHVAYDWALNDVPRD